MVRPLKITSVARSKSTFFEGMPSICTRPPTRTSANAWWVAAGTPDISSTTSAPRPPVDACKRERLVDRGRRSRHLQLPGRAEAARCGFHDLLALVGMNRDVGSHLL